MPTEDIKRAKRLFYSVNIIWSLFFATANWLFWWRHFLSNGQIGFVDGLVFLIGMLAEIPSGAVADRIGRRKAMIISAILMGVGYGASGLALNGSMILVGYAVYILGYALFSGTDDAYLYDYLKAHGDTDEWEDIARKKQLVRRLGNLTAIFIGGFLFIWNPRLPSIFRGAAFLLMLVPLLRMAFMDKSEHHRQEERPENYLKHIGEGMKELLNRRMLPTILLILVVQGITITVFIQGILRPLMLERSSLRIDYHAFYITGIAFLTLPLLWRKIKDMNKAYARAMFWSGCILLGFILNIPARNFILNLTGIGLIHVGASLIVPATSALVNAVASPRHRATAISTANLLEDLPYVILAPFIGVIVDHGLINYVVYGVIAAMATAMLFSWSLRNRQTVSIAR